MEPTEPGWYVARMKTWAIGSPWAIVKVTQHDSDLAVWQAGDNRAWAVNKWDWRERVYPEALLHT